MKIEPNYLYRVLPRLASDGQVKRDGQGWHPARHRRPRVPNPCATLPHASRHAPPSPSRRHPQLGPQRTRRAGQSTTSATNGRTAPGATKASVLAALAGGEAMTAGQVATKAGLARPTVSTTLSKLAKTGEVQKADRGYRLPSAA